MWSWTISLLASSLTPGAVEDRWPRKAEAYPVVLGCVPWFTHTGIAAVLASMSGCIVIDKGSTHQAATRRLAANGEGVWQMLLGFWDWAPGGSIIGPYGPLPGDRDLESVRVLGYANNAERKVGKPLLHAKIAVCCAAWRWESEGGGWDDILTPMTVWLGSANWTHTASSHIEFGAWSTDESLCEHALDFVRSIITASEPVTSAAPGPMPELRPGEFDDDAMWEAYQAILTDPEDDE